MVKFTCLKEKEIDFLIDFAQYKNFKWNTDRVWFNWLQS